jgi:hypothetical protein
MMDSNLVKARMKRITDSRGTTVIGVLVATLLVGILAALAATLFGNMAQFTARSWTETEIVCNNALKDSAGNPLTWNYKTESKKNVGRIVAPGSPTTVITSNQRFGPTLALTNMYLREPDATKNESGKAESTIFRNGKSYDSVAARLVLQFKNPAQILGGTLQERYVNLILGIDSSSGYKIKFCFPQSDLTMARYSCTQTTLLAQPSAYAEPDCSAPSSPNCQRLYYVSGFLDSGGPICACKWICPPVVEVTHPVY